MARPSTYFTTLDGTPVLYDRLGDDYGKTGIPYKFYAERDFERQLDAFVAEVKRNTEDLFGPLKTVLSAGAYVSKPGAHGLGRAFDADGFIWERKSLVADEQPSKKPLYLLVQAIANKRFGVVLGYNYNEDHEDHLHLDDSRPARFRESQSVTNFIQEALILLFAKNITRDGDWGNDTETAFTEVLDDLGHSYPPDNTAWAAFTDAVVREARFMMGAAGAEARPVAPAADDDDDLDRLDGIEDRHAADDDDDVDAGAPLVLTGRRETGRPDLSYAPLPGWSVREQSGSRKKWYLSTNQFDDLYIGYDFDFPNTPWRGLARTGRVSQSLFYAADDHRGEHGIWADFLVPTALCESESNFFVVNCYDSAAITVGFFQMAAHTNKNMAELFRDIWTALPDEADQFFPEIRLGAQIGRGEPRELFAVNGTDALSLEVEASPSDGLYTRSYDRGRFMDFFNPNRAKVDAEEIQMCARWLAWLNISPRLRKVVVANAVSIAKRNVRALHKLVRNANLPGYGNGLDGVAMSIVSACMDTKHHGRRNRDKNMSTNASILHSLGTDDPLGSLSFIDTKWREDRSKRVVAEIRSRKATFEVRKFDAAGMTFR